jgi:hypothetical protein
MSRLGVQLSVPRHALLLALSAALVSLACANRAQATCGDYLQMAADHSEAGHVPSDDHGSKPADAPCGCRGAQCGGTPLAPPAPKAPLRGYSQQDGNLLSIADRSLTLYGSWARFYFAARPNSGYPLLLNRPPDART